MRKKLSTEEKMAIILEGLCHEKSVSQICKEHGISQALYYKLCDYGFYNEERYQCRLKGMAR